MGGLCLLPQLLEDRGKRINRGHLPLSSNFKASLNRSYLKDKTKPNKRQTQNLSVTFLSQIQKSESNPEETPGNPSDGSLKHKGQEKKNCSRMKKNKTVRKLHNAITGCFCWSKGQFWRT